MWQGSLGMHRSNPELSKSCPASLGAFSPGRAPWPENLHLSSEVWNHSLHFWAGAIKIQCPCWATNPASSPTIWPGNTYQHHGDDRMAHRIFKVTSFRYLVAFWIGIPFMAWVVSWVFLKESESRLVMSDQLLRRHGLYSPWNSPGQNTAVGSLFLFQGIFPTQGSNPGLPHCRQILYQLSHKGSPRILDG